MKLSNTTIYILIFSLIILLLTILGYFRYLKFENAKKYQNCGYTLVNNIINPELLLKINKKINNLELETYNNCCKKDINRKSVVLYNETDNINILKQPILDNIKKIIDNIIYENMLKNFNYWDFTLIELIENLPKTKEQQVYFDGNYNYKLPENGTNNHMYFIIPLTNIQHNFYTNEKCIEEKRLEKNHDYINKYRSLINKENHWVFDKRIKLENIKTYNNYHKQGKSETVKLINKNLIKYCKTKDNPEIRLIDEIVKKGEDDSIFDTTTWFCAIIDNKKRWFSNRISNKKRLEKLVNARKPVNSKKGDLIAYKKYTLHNTPKNTTKNSEKYVLIGIKHLLE